jgi:hypothetical protein
MSFHFLDHPYRSIWSVHERKVVDDVLTGNVPVREVRNKKRHFTVRPISPFPSGSGLGSCFTVFQGMQFKNSSNIVNAMNG